MKTLTVYTKPNCPYCDQAKMLLETRGIVYTTVNVAEIPSAREFLVDQGLRSVPQIFDGTVLLPGGFQGLTGQPEEFWTNLKENNEY
jgi:glutaredoxin 3